MLGHVIVWSYIRIEKNADKNIDFTGMHVLLKSKEDGRISICSNIEKPIHNQNTWFSLQKEMLITRKNR